jgi:hypothetical protein
VGGLRVNIGLRWKWLESLAFRINTNRAALSGMDAERTMEFILEQMARFDAQIGQNSAAIAQMIDVQRRRQETTASLLDTVKVHENRFALFFDTLKDHHERLATLTDRVG